VTPAGPVPGSSPAHRNDQEVVTLAGSTGLLWPPRDPLETRGPIVVIAHNDRSSHASSFVSASVVWLENVRESEWLDELER
jgi:hypothetical protein